ncbi:Alpha/beta hydrolase family protein [Variovorax sp. SRS16]|uniref:alpha/beta hydrolase n=1 Tax=Variovorax sp. SRS16 TaxID=282217 RepID=UPI0013173700|nr:alpha/beta hydrolase [Variovorax sp. SRS16]VTU13049.1 Alpha/beta hydrolase family protein [Variovorax sp. SRS16]
MPHRTGRPLARAAAALCLALSLGLPSMSVAQTPSVENHFVRIAPRVAGVLYTPVAASPHRHVAVVVMHDNNDFLDHPSTVQLASRGFTVLAANPRYAPDLDDRDMDWDAALLDLASAVRYARGLAGIDRVVLLGHSSGAPLAAAYQNIAENGVKACQGPEKIVPCPDAMAALRPADALVLLDPIFGLGANVLTSVDPSLADGSTPADPSLDIYAPANGFTATGATYSDAFRKRFLKAQAARNAVLVERALQQRQAIAEGRGAFADDAPFVVPGATRTPRLWRPDLHLLSHTQGSYTLLRGDGTHSTEVIHTLRVPSGLTPTVVARNDREADRPASAASNAGTGAASAPARPLLLGGSLDTTVKRFLSTFATRATADYDITEDSVSGIDWNSSYTSMPGNVEGVKVPLLVMGMTGHYWLVSAETAYRHAASKDKSIAFVEGATHGFAPCQPCAKTPGQFGDTAGRTFAYVADWIGAHF